MRDGFSSNSGHGSLKAQPVVFSWPTFYAPAAANALATALIEGNPGARDIMRMLKDHRMVVLAMDRDILNTGQRFKFFGRLTSFPTGPVEIALKTGAPILPAFCIRDENDAYIAVGDPPLFLTPSEDHAADVRGAMEQILATFERYIKKYPDQWHVCLLYTSDAADE